MQKKIKILRVINRFNLGGPTYNVTFLSAFMDDRFETKLIGGGHENYEGDALFIPHKYGVKPQIIDSLQREINFKKDNQALKEIRQIIKGFKPDIVHTHASKSGAIGRLAAIKENVPVIVHTFHGHVFHSYFGKVKTQFYKTVERYLAKKSTAIVAISEIQRNELVDIHKVVPKEKAKIINLGFDLTKFQTKNTQKRQKFVEDYNINEDEVCIGIIGRLTPIKNHQMFFEVVKNVVQNTNQKIRIFVIGGGELENSLKTQAKTIEKQLGKTIFTFTSWIKDVDVPLSRLDVVCLTSHNEGTPVSLIEAQASNVVVMSTNVGGVKDVILEGETGFVIEDFSVKAYVQKLLNLVEDKEKRIKMSQNGWNYVKDKFHYTTLCKNMEKLYLELLQNNEK
ncbi:MAG TPA: glycosyltransferase family 1 protein [Crocinitomix sp.]|nr:glycosyltransferase family 1 protein [Crocinitomix sp.]